MSGDFQAANFSLEKLESSLAGTMLLVEYDGKFRRLLAWLWKYGLSRDVITSPTHLSGDSPDHSRLGRVYTLAGSSPQMVLHEKGLERKWSGRLYLQEYDKEPLVPALFRCIGQDVRNTLGDFQRVWQMH